MRKVLIVDDQILILQSLSRLLTFAGFSVITAPSGETGIEIYKDNNPAYVILDINLPDISGLEVFRKIRRFNPQAIVYFMSGGNNLVSPEESTKLGASGYFTKPCRPNEIIQALNSQG